MAFSEKVKKLREEKGFSQAELADMTGLTQSMIAQYERGTKIPTIVTGVLLAKRLNTTCEELVS